MTEANTTDYLRQEQSQSARFVVVAKPQPSHFLGA